MALTLAGGNDALDPASIALSKVKNKVEQPLPSRILADMSKKGMDRNSPIMIRIFKEEGVMEILKANQSNRFEVIADYKICAWSGRLGPKVKEGDRQAPEGFYMLTPANLNPNSKYYLAINTGFPNRYDAANGRTGADLMIHGACSSSGCYSMTDQQVLEIYAFARDAFKGGQKAVQLEAFPFRMTAENMWKHRLSPNIEFWKMLKVGYDNFEVTKRPPDVEVCEKKYVFNQQASGPFNASGKCPVMTTPPALQMALATYDKQYQADYATATKKFDGMVAYAPTGTALAAGKMMKVADLESMMSNQSAQQVARGGTAISPTANPTTASIRVATASPATAGPVATAQQPAAGPVIAANVPANVPIPTANPMNPGLSALAYAPAPTVETAQTEAKKPPFWKFWAKSE